MPISGVSSARRPKRDEFHGPRQHGQGQRGTERGRNTMKSRLLGLLAAAALSVITSGAAQAQEILLGNLYAGAGPFATLSRTIEIAAQMAIEEINASGGINGKK